MNRCTTSREALPDGDACETAEDLFAAVDELEALSKKIAERDRAVVKKTKELLRTVLTWAHLTLPGWVGSPQ